VESGGDGRLLGILLLASLLGLFGVFDADEWVTANLFLRLGVG